ncbi:translation elongation factor EF-1, subunit alpha [Sulfolobus islandicus Y.G.57.14]|jgi:elongation factor 1-alpha|uniref:Elongation factor 1-alpha n=10 Tax=Saccharolobus islandicus TaxID=43080 RepID=M9UAS1_SACIS|nr:translation elongation factor EF-1 subunit alpha [Sulfolobus islandicus]CAC42886.1 elongation factor 1 alpha (EF-1A) [Saccharolobus solfataricus]ACP36022.1 translation elongation factor EF-1, subunit alpha [Sulfolobus islandicus L.S.2.15]ACP38662.1 translation elongation factor EF-1, subunit alpha [Sulfolobus islandicus M.14.25]ACP46251.1 translation elongation factor EF-1, subunit alpha [Sulfolobus islandicus Y.G.57.14]ACP48034.1 translation elongation factor EF-1, subunit alpha [Sulfolobu
MSQKPHLNLIVIGHIDHGKSTLVGRLLMDRGFIDEKTVKEAEEAAKKLGKESEKFAFLLDRLKEERERGVTINLTFMRFETKKYFFTIIDAPGHRDFVKNMITGASQADAAILVVSAKKGEYEAGMSVEGQTREHIILAKTMGLDQLIVAVNKMDLTEPPYDEKRYKEIVDQVSKFMRSYGFNTNKVRFVPVVAPSGDNITHKSENMKWYNGPTLEEYLDQLELPPKPVDKPLRIPIQDVYSISGVGTVPVGRVESGVLKVGDKIVFMPAGKVGEVRSIETHHTKMDKAEPGDNIGFNVRGVEKKDIKRGDVVGHPNNPPTVADEFTARIIVVWHPTALANGYTPVLHVHTASVACRVSELVSKLDPRTGQEAEKNPQFLKQGDVAIVKFKPIKPLCVEKYNEFPPLGRFAMRDMGKTVGVGIIVDVKPAKVEIK